MTRLRTTTKRNGDTTVVTITEAKQRRSQPMATNAGCAYPACLAILVAVAWAVAVFLGRVTW